MHCNDKMPLLVKLREGKRGTTGAENDTLKAVR